MMNSKPDSAMVPQSDSNDHIRTIIVKRMAMTFKEK